MPPGRAHVSREISHRSSHDSLGENVEGEADDLTATAVTESLMGKEHNIRRIAGVIS